MSDRQKREDAIFREEHAKVKAEERHKQFLNDKSVGEGLDRPDDAFIERHTGKRLDSLEQANLAGVKMGKRVRQERADEKLATAREKSLHAHNKSLETPIDFAQKLDVSDTFKNKANDNSQQKQLERAKAMLEQQQATKDKDLER